MERRRRQVPASIPLSGLLKSIEKRLNSDPLFAKIGWFCRLGRSRAPVAQLDRAFAFEAKGCRFDSCPGAFIEIAIPSSQLKVPARSVR
jgi:hypothetical protein